ncbi:Cytosine deaminase-related metal-dependent hydrolase [Thermoplasmatales archaeon BRNA1]|nr:Cytosine deaminase-related metal-dependent hydrolase [Thermoplasmatales archaeon BRNA1]
MITVFRDAWILTQNATRDVIKGDLVVDGEKIVSVGGKYNGTADREIDCSKDVIMPGLINTHTHIAMEVMKGTLDDLLFPDFLNRSFKVDADRTDDDLAVGTKLGCMEMMASGTTTFVDMYYSEDIIAKATQEAGIRGVCCWCCLDEDKTTQKGNPVQNCKNFYQQFKGQRKIIPGVALQGVYCCNEDTCVEANAFSEEVNAPLTFHLSETRGEVNNHKAETRMRPAEWLSHIGVLNDRCIAAHSAWLTMNEIRLMGEAGMSISSCPVSNMKLATGGVAPIPEFNKYGVNVSLGTDGNTTNNTLDVIAEMRSLALLQKSSRWDPTVLPAQELLDIVTVNGAKAIHMEDKLGSLEPGKFADIVVLDGRMPNIRPLVKENLVSVLAYSVSSANVKTVMCQGDLVYEDRKFLTLDAERIMDESEPAWQKLCLR